MLILALRERESILLCWPDGRLAEVAVMKAGREIRVGIDAPKECNVTRSRVDDKTDWKQLSQDERRIALESLGAIE